MLRAIDRLDLNTGKYTPLCYVPGHCFNGCGISPETNEIFCREKLLSVAAFDRISVSVRDLQGLGECLLWWKENLAFFFSEDFYLPAMARFYTSHNWYFIWVQRLTILIVIISKLRLFKQTKNVFFTLLCLNSANIFFARPTFNNRNCPCRPGIFWGEEQSQKNQVFSYAIKTRFGNATSILLHPTWHFQISLGLVARLAITWFVLIVLWTWRKWSWAYLLLRWKEACAFLVRFLEPMLPILTWMEAFGAGWGTGW